MRDNAPSKMTALPSFTGCFTCLFELLLAGEIEKNYDRKSRKPIENEWNQLKYHSLYPRYPLYPSGSK